VTKLYVGPKNSGKSLAAEGFCTRGGSCPTYLATLPKLPEFESRISRHQRRRARSPWRMRYMCVPAPNLLEEMAEASRESGLVLLDGFSAILKAQYCFFGADAPSMANGSSSTTNTRPMAARCLCP
jgi:adenosyl cobinamide kinase/adenosyl cobinamide phosphate guanylyltransferase